MNEKLRNACRTCITFTCVPGDEETLPVGTSRLGGRPDLSVEERWPSARTRSFHYEYTLAHTFIGVTGDYVPASAVLNPWFLARMVL